jgi:acyl-CoA synthetase (NDP forming)
MVADAGEVHGLSLPRFAPETVVALEQAISSYGATFNPLDVTGAAVRDPSMWEGLIAIAARDPAIGVVGVVYDMPRGPEDYVNRVALKHIGSALARVGKPALLINQALRPVGSQDWNTLTEFGVPCVAGGLDLVVRALAAVQRWSRGLARLESAPSLPAISRSSVRPRSEREALEYLRAKGVGTPPCVCAPSAGEAVSAWRTMGSPVVLKIASPAIQHKSDIGGVRLGLNDAEAITVAFNEIVAAATAAFPGATIDGCLVMPMRPDGVELFVGTARTAWGPAIAVGLGGIWIEALADVAVRLLPVSEGDVLEMLDSLRGRKLLGGFRGQPAVDRAAVAAQIIRIGEAAVALGPDLVSLEVNPLRVRGTVAEALDALAVWDDAA